MNRYEVVLFDLGGVLVELTGVPTMIQWSNRMHDDDSLWFEWLHSKSVRSFETGLTSASQFAEQIIDEMDLAVEKSEFLDRFYQWPRGLFPGVTELLASLRERHTLACLSNTNELHWPRLMHEMGLEQMLDHHFPSHLLGMLKPDVEVFKHVVQCLSCKPGAILFFDDNAINVESAREAGMVAHRARGPEDIRKIYDELELSGRPG
jgi:putative hydrolase of the HAD superfamily